MSKFNKFVTAAMVFTILTGCSGNTVANDSLTDTSSESTAEYTTVDIDRTSAQTVAEGFINAIENSDFVTALSLIDIQDGTYLTPEDLEYVIRRSIIGYMIGQPEAFMNSPYFNESSGEATYNFYTTEDYDIETLYTLDLTLNESNVWCIKKTNFVKESVLFYVPEGVRFYLNDIEIGTKYKQRTENSVDIYCVPEVARRSFTTTIVSSIFGEITGELAIPMYNALDPTTFEEGEPIEVYREITPQLFEELGARTQYMYNEIYLMMDSESPAENLNQFITGSKNYKFVEQYYNNGISARRSVSTDTNAHRYTGTEILEFWQNPNMVSYVYSNDTIVLNMILSMRWLNEGSIESAKLSAGVKLTKTPGGEWLINDITPGAWINLINGIDESDGVNAW